MSPNISNFLLLSTLLLILLPLYDDEVILRSRFVILSWCHGFSVLVSLIIWGEKFLNRPVLFWWEQWYSQYSKSSMVIMRLICRFVLTYLHFNSLLRGIHVLF